MESLEAFRQGQQKTVAEIVAAGVALMADWTAGGNQRTRITDCGDADCGYASCRLAKAIQDYERIADREGRPFPTNATEPVSVKR